VGGLELRAVVKHYTTATETIRAVDGVSLDVQAGELVALYGPSGAGKSTLLLLAAGLLAPDRGSVRFDGRDVSAMSDREAARYRREDVGFIFQGFHLMANSSALDNATLKLAAAGLGVRAARARAAAWLERVGLGERAYHRPGELSMGERQRVAIARALAGEPRLLLADEPTANLDSRRTGQIFELLGEVCRERGVPGVLVTHDPRARTFVDRVYGLRDGRLVELRSSGLERAL
jgi:ABC-type lipoprotein export system ATPase subunit